MNAPPTVRFAPSPTGLLHIGNARTAIYNWLFAKERGGRFILRYDDTDRERSTEAFIRAIAEDLGWLGIVPDQVARQSERFALYGAAAERLRAAGRLYACYETEEELDYRRKRQLAMHRPPIYDRAALKLTDADRARLEGEGRRPYWRFLLEPRAVAWDDRVRGPQSIDCASLSDPVLIRADDSYLYTLPSVVDDIDPGVTDVIRGEDHVTNTAVQIQLFEALGSVPPRFAHHNLLTLPSGEGLSKRLGHLSLAKLREAGFEPAAVAARSRAWRTCKAGSSSARSRIRRLSSTRRSSARSTPARFTICRTTPWLTGLRRSASPAARRSGMRCAAISKSFPMRSSGGRWCRGRRSRRPRRRTAISSPVPSSSCRPSRGTRRPGPPGPKA
jgi:glutamyl-tRNA synthetase